MATISDFCYQVPTLWQHLLQVTSPSWAQSQWDQLRPYRYVSMYLDGASMGAYKYSFTHQLTFVLWKRQIVSCPNMLLEIPRQDFLVCHYRPKCTLPWSLTSCSSSLPQQLDFYLKTAPKQNLKVKPHNGKKNLSSPKSPLKLGPRWDMDNNLDNTQTYIHMY